MEKVYKLIRQKVVISPNIRSVVDLKAEVYSQDIDVTKIVIELESESGERIDLTDAKVTVGLKINDVTIEDVGQVEDVKDMLISYCPGERFKINEGTVTLGFFVTLNTGQRIDIQNYKINFKRSLIDTATEEEVKPYFTSLDTIVTELKEHTASKKYEVDDSVNHAKSEIDNKVNTVEASKTTAVDQIGSYLENSKTAMDSSVAYVRSVGETQKAAINTVTSDVNDYANSQKKAMDSVVTDVQSEGEKTKTEIKAVISDVNGYADSQKQAIHNIVDGGTYTKSETDAKDTSILDSAKTYADSQIAAAKATIIDGNVASASKLAATRLINGVEFDGSKDISLSTDDIGTYNKLTIDSKDAGILSSSKSYTDTSINNAKASIVAGNVATATKLQTARTIAGVLFDGSANISIGPSDVGTYSQSDINAKDTSTLNDAKSYADTKKNEAVSYTNSQVTDLKNHLIFVGTQAQWDALPETEKAKYILRAVTE